MFAQRTSGLAAAALAAVVALALLGAEQRADARRLPTLRGSLACAKDYMVNLVRDKIISKSALVAEYERAMESVRERYARAEQAGELANKDQKERENFYLKLTVEEMRHMKARMEARQPGSQLELAADEAERARACKGGADYDPDAEVANWSPDDDEALEDDRDVEEALLTELDELERQAAGEDEMGWSLSPEVKESLKVRTRVVLTDLVNNEARQIAMSILTAYLTGGSGSLVSLVAPMLGGLKFKLAEFLINAITDVISAIMGRQIHVSPGNVVPAQPAVELATEAAPAVPVVA